MGARFYDPSLNRFLSPDSIVPQPGNPQNLNRYAYALANPLKYRDPSGHWVETAWDIVNIGWDIYQVKEDPSALNIGCLIVDLAAAALPFVPAGVGLLAHGGTAAKLGAEVVTHGDEVADAARVLSHVDDTLGATRLLGRTVEGLERFKTAGREVLPDVVKAFKGAVDYGASKLPGAFKGRNVRTIGSLADTTAAAMERGAKILDGPWSLDRNYDWIMEGVGNGDVFELVTEVGEDVLTSEKYEISVFARELDTLLQAGYVRVGDFLVPPTP
jgi:hypothetical protein